MSTRISSAAVLLLIAACSDKPDTNVIERTEADQRAAASDAGAIECALAGAQAYVRECTIDREASDRGLVLTVRHPDGGFRRLLVTKDGRGVVAGDGAEAARVSILSPQEIEVAVGHDRYRLPATIGSGKTR